MDISAVSSLLSLMGMFVSQASKKEERTIDQFEKWLDRHQHQEIKDMITATVGLQQELDQVLRQEHAEMLCEIQKGNKLLSEYVSRRKGFEFIARAIPTESLLSEQAVSLIRDFVLSERLELFINRQFGFLVIFNNGSMTEKVCWEVKDQRFIQEDVEQLEELGLIALKDISEHNWKFSLTRSAVTFVEGLREGS